MGVIQGTLLASPTAPELPPGAREREPEPRSVAQAEIAILDSAGEQVRTVTSGPDGSFRVELPPGRYVVQPAAVRGLIGTPEPVEVEVTGGEVTEVSLTYDTGIR